MSHDCAIVVDLWKHWGKTTTANRTLEFACCTSMPHGINASRSFISSDIPNVSCHSDGKVEEIQWRGQSLSGSIPDSIGNLKNLKDL
jgi:hypothetical protein